jgi:hypothetical protein
LRDRHIGRLLALEDAGNIDSGLALQIVDNAEILRGCTDKAGSATVM